MRDDPFYRDPDIQAAADYATEIHVRDARRGYAETGLSEDAIEELISAGLLKPHRLTDGTLTEAAMKREFSDGTFREIQALRRRS